MEPSRVRPASEGSAAAAATRAPDNDEDEDNDEKLTFATPLDKRVIRSSNDDDLVPVRLHNKRTGTVTEYWVEKGTPMSEVLKTYARDRHKQNNDLKWHVLHQEGSEPPEDSRYVDDHLHTYSCQGCLYPNCDNACAEDDSDKDDPPPFFCF